ncbi:MAG: SDR family oxidoreductase [Gemmatimonadota bacterium]|nr:SDR family oxidoreductase [Gemmatimonadota bacterium]
MTQPPRITHGPPFLVGKHAIITGGGHGLGRTIAAALARAGARVTIMGRDAAILANTAREISANGVDAIAISCDVADPAAVASAFGEATETSGAAHVLVNNAGRANSADFTATTLEDWRHTIDVNLTGPFMCSQQVLPAMLRQAAGRIINIASTAALRGYPSLSAYCASKHGLLGLTRSLAAEVARHGVTVNAVCPGYTEGGMSDQAIRSIVRLRHVDADEALAMLVRNNPSRKLTTQDEVAATVLWLCSEQSSAITGQAIAVAGGEVM